MMRKSINPLVLIALVAGISAPVFGAGAASRISPLTTYPVALEADGVYSIVEYVAIGEIGQTLPGSGVKISVNGYNLTAGFKKDRYRFEYTYMKYTDDSLPAGALQSDTMAANVFHLAYSIPMEHGWGKWTGDAVAGLRWFENGVGELGEVYLARQFSKENIDATLGINALERSTRFDHRLGFYADASYGLRPGISFISQYYSADFFKNVMNDYVAPYMYWIPPDQRGCDVCSEDTAALGLSFQFLEGRGNAYFMYYFVGEQYGYIPMFGMTAKLR